MHESLRTCFELQCRRHTRTVEAKEAASTAVKNNVPEIVRYKGSAICDICKIV